jgi:hypothetical protein
MVLMMRLRFVVPLLLVSVAPADLAAQSGRSTLSVGVADAESGKPIPRVEVVMPELRLLVLTDSMGQARIPDIPFGQHRVRVRLLGYEPSDIELEFSGDTTGAVFRLGRSSGTLPAVDVTAAAVPAQLKDFEVRRKQGIGRFLVETDLAREADRDFTLVASMRFPGLSMRTDADGQVHIASTRSSCGADGSRPSTDNRGVERIGGKPGMKPAMGSRGIEGEPVMTGSCASERPCLVPIFLDNIPLGEADNSMIRTWDLSGAEYYTGNSVPARYRRSGTACGALVLWSKWR